ncbi:hypothetical protein [Leifsonia shinshuensis]|uniref:hypothetical protein n=1 Tax=Leifsonia shinshuensis TaxID=150026 RepID=UPI0028608EA8|nr:hypothetical protein [Leifsonia shinshuensis]MDR6973290.1 hypothetical protein [Leifsonia shinshuensis]
MTDEQDWQAPGSQGGGTPGADGAQGAQPPQYGQQPPQYGQQPPQYGQQAPQYGQQPPQYGWQQPPYGQQYAPAGGQPGWTPPPKPGLIPLRPLTLGPLLAAPFQALRRNPRITVGAALILQGIPAILVSVLIAGGIALLVSRALSADAQDKPALQAGLIGGTIVLGVLSLVITTVFGALLQGVIVAEVARETLGEKLTFGALWRLVRGRFGALIGFTLLFALAWIVVIALVIAIVVALASIGGVAGTIGAIAVGLIGGLGLIPLAVWINTKLAMVPSAIVLERLPMRSAVARSWSLTNGYFWRTFGIIALVWLIVYAITQTISIPFGLLGGLIGGVFAPTAASAGDSASSMTQLIVTQLGVNVLASIVTAVVGAIGSVIQTAAVSLLYLDLRMRKEGLDLELVRFVEGRQTGQDLPDPYLPPAERAQPPQPPAAAGWPAG